MSATDGLPNGTDRTLDELPEFDLSYLLDDGDHPSSVTVYSPDALETAWLTAGCEDAVSLSDVR
ncbi:hypothetical protein [Halorarum halobium]|uniref:hypothetical protein n=1 Tax=Halorarum halobium TaxID=3075121 RepID=UPI0028ACC5F0|nr:hypothetical protein [Halobaculum sp. XH14]